MFSASFATTRISRTLAIRSRRSVRHLELQRTQFEQRQNANYLTRRKALDGWSEFAFTPFDAVLVTAVTGLSFGAWKLYLYFQLEYVTAAMIGNHVPTGGARVLQIGGGTRELYYYPQGTIQVSITQSSTKKGVLENSGIAAKIPVVVREASHSFLNLGSDGYYDAVVILQKFSNSSNQVTLLKDIHRVLKSDGVLIFIEKSDDLMTQLSEKSEMFGDVKSDVALEGKDDHIVGVARKDVKTGFATP